MNTQEALNRSMPAAKHAMLGDVLANLIAQYNALLADVEAILALPTVDGLFVGPSDLSLSRGRGAYAKTEADFDDLRRIAASSERRLVAGDPVGRGADLQAEPLLGGPRRRPGRRIRCCPNSTRPSASPPSA